MDHDIIATHASIASEEKRQNHKLNIRPEQSLKSLVQARSDPICGTGGCEQLKRKKKDSYPMDYPVPSFGADPDIAGTQSNLNWAESSTGHNWHFTFEKPPVNPAAKTMYNFAPELDSDVKHTIKHTSDAEDSLNHNWRFDDESAVQVSSDPICSSAGCE